MQAHTAIHGLLAGLLLAALAPTAPAQTADWHRLPTLMPSATQCLAFDARRERMVRVEGSGWDSMLRTWEWIGDAWSLRRTALTPPPRSDFAVAYDPVRQRVVLFGGRRQFDITQPGAVLDDTWEYDGLDWVQSSPLQRPPAQLNAQFTFDYVHNKLLLCGGYAPVGGAGGWHYDGVTWTPTAAAPLSGMTTAIGSDPIRQRVVLYIGVTISLLYEWDGFTWQQKNPPQSPPPRFSARFTYVPQRQRLVLHGGQASVWPGDLWEWDGVTWSSLGTAPVRAEHTLCHDPVRNRLFAVGGRTVPNFGVDTLQWDGVGWSSSPDGIGWDDVAGAWFDFNRLGVVAVSVYPAALLQWNGAAWDRQPWPTPMLSPRGAFDSSRNVAVVVGSNAPGVVTQEWDGTNWSAQLPVTLPSVARPSFHPGRGRVVASCGSAGLFEWSGLAWSSIAPGPGAPWNSVGDAGAVYDPARGELVQVAWQGGVPITARWNGTTWSVGSFPNGPTQRSNHGICFDDASQCVVLFGGVDAASSIGAARNDLWQWDGVTWTQRVLTNAPPARERCGLVFDPLRQQLLALGGRSTLTSLATVATADAWALDSQSAHAVTTLGAGCGGAAGVPRLLFTTPNPGTAVFAAELHGGPAQAACGFAFSFGSAVTPVGAGCSLYLAASDAVMLTYCSGAGIATVTTAIPLALQGFSFVGQAAVLDPASALGVSLTAGQHITVGR